jgi:hypothetical protein
MIKRTVSKSVAENTPNEIWNAFIDLIAIEDYKNLDQTQRLAHLAFWYDSELQNGGHLQFFENRGTELLDETLTALQDLGAKKQHKILEKARKKWLAGSRSKKEEAEDYIDEALEGEFETLDDQYYECEPSINDLLEGFLAKNRSSFVEII